MKLKNIIVLDTTLRDGAQIPGINLFRKDKILIAKLLEELKVDIIEAGFAANSLEEQQTLKDISKIIKHCKVSSLARSVDADIILAAKALEHAEFPLINVFSPISDILIESQLKKSHSEILEMIYNSISLAKKYFPDVQWTGMDSTRASEEFLIQCIETAIQAGADRINIADTIGFVTPWDINQKLSLFTDKFPEVIFSVHCHNDLGLATANALAGVIAGARQVEVTINGIGERAGNTPLEEFVMALKLRPEIFKSDCLVNIKKIDSIVHQICKVMNQKIAKHKPIIGSNCFSHGSGIHQDGMLKNPRTYQLFSPIVIGKKKYKLKLTKFSGSSYIRHITQKLGYQLETNQIKKLMIKIKSFLAKNKFIRLNVLKKLIDETK
jgi:2-isopropylmalate synthase